MRDFHPVAVDGFPDKQLFGLPEGYFDGRYGDFKRFDFMHRTRNRFLVGRVSKLYGITDEVWCLDTAYPLIELL